MVCPVCAFAVAGGVGILRGLGVNDAITGIWVGALIVSIIIWTVDWMNRKNIHFLFRKIIVIVFYYAVVIWPLYHWEIMGKGGNIIFSMDRLLFGIIIGTILFISAVLSDVYLRKINEEKPAIKYQKVIVPIAYLIVASIILHFLIVIFSG